MIKDSFYADSILAWVESQGGLEAVKKRLMPEGMEWPRYENGEFVKLGDELEHYEQGHRFKVDVVEFTADGWRACYEGDGVRDVYPPGERVKRSAKVLDADGVEIRVGDTVWHEDGSELVVEGFGDEEDGETLVRVSDMSETSVGWSGCRSLSLTHRAPVLAADGKPLEVGQTVWGVSNGIEFTVARIPKSGEYQAVKLRLDDGAFTGLDPDQLTHQRPVLDADGVPIKVGDTVYFTDGREQEWNTVVHAEYDYKDEPYVQLGRLNEAGYPKYTNCSCIDPSQLTHTKPDPDTWERIEHDALVIDEMIESEWDGDPTDARDLVRRCKALAERDR